MFFAPDDPHEIFRRAVRDFVEKECPTEKVREWDQKREYPYALFDKMAELGWMGLPIPEGYGGSYQDMFYLIIVAEEIARYSSDIGNEFAEHCWGSIIIREYGSEEQKRHYLPKLAKGEVAFSFSNTEPDAGSDGAAIITAARPEGEEFVINGQKIFATSAAKRDNVILLTTRTDRSGPKHKGITCFLVPNTTPGVQLKRLDTLARRICGTYEMFLDSVRVPAPAMLGPLHEGWGVVLRHLDIERATVAAAYIGNAQGALDQAIRYAKERRQFGRPIGEFQAIKHLIADLQTEVDAARLLVYRAAWLIDRGVPCRKEVSMAKLMTSEVSLRVATAGMQILGGYAQLPEFDMERHWRNAKQSTVGGGTSQIQRSIIGTELGL